MPLAAFLTLEGEDLVTLKCDVVALESIYEGSLEEFGCDNLAMWLGTRG